MKKRKYTKKKNVKRKTVRHSKNSFKSKAVKRKKDPQKAKKPLIQKIVSILRKRIKEKQRLKPKNEYRYNHNTKHMNYIFAETADKNKSIGITSKETTFGRKNMPLKNNPKKNQQSDQVEASYVRNGIISDKKGSYAKKTAKNIQFSSEDMANVKAKIRHYKKERKRKSIKEKENE